MEKKKVIRTAAPVTRSKRGRDDETPASVNTRLKKRVSSLEKSLKQRDKALDEAHSQLSAKVKECTVLKRKATMSQNQAIKDQKKTTKKLEALDEERNQAVDGLYLAERKIKAHEAKYRNMKKEVEVAKIETENERQRFDSDAECRVQQALRSHQMELANMKARVEIQAIYRVAAEFARSRGKPNPLANPVAYSDSGYSAARTFSAGLKRAGYASVQDLLDKPDHYVMGFHGTPSDEIILNIFMDGFDPDKRKRQNFGPGEYFYSGDSNWTSYSGATSCHIVTLIIKKNWGGSELAEYKFVPEKEYSVVNNDTLRRYSYTLPCAVASSDEIRTELAKMLFDRLGSKFSSLGLEAPTSTAWSKVVRSARALHVKDTTMSNGWRKLSWIVQARIKAAVVAGKTVCGYTVGSQTYSTDLEEMTQRNVLTGKVRKLHWFYASYDE